MKPRRLRAASAVTALALVAGCASDSGESGGASAATTDSATQAERRDQTPARPAAARRPRLLLLGNFAEPTFVTAPRGDRRRFVVEREGRIRVVSRGRVLEQPFLDITERVTSGGESGLLSMAFAPNYRRSRAFYVYYTDNSGFIQIDRFRAKGNHALPASRRSVLRVPHRRFNHKGGQIQFGPDGFLYAGFGDGGSSGDPDENAQNLGRMLGKLVRIAPRSGGGYRVPRDNPFRNRSGALPEVYAYGLRNPYRFSFDRRTGDLTIGDVGQNAVEEIDFVPNGRGRGRAPRGGYNFGWDAFEGRSRFEGGDAPGHLMPVIDHGQNDGWCSIIGGYVIRDRSLGSLYGRYIYGDYCKPELRVASLRRRGPTSRDLGLSVSDLVSFGEDGRGRVYAVSLGGPVYRLAARR